MKPRIAPEDSLTHVDGTGVDGGQGTHDPPSGATWHLVQNNELLFRHVVE